MLLSDKELWALVPNADNLNDARAIEGAILAKLGAMELPEPIKTYPKGRNGPAIGVYSSTQLHQAYAQGAAAQLSHEPSAFLHTWTDGEKQPWLTGRDYRLNDQPITVEPLYTRREAK